MNYAVDDKVCYFVGNVCDGIALPDSFTYPFLYRPHPLAVHAAADLQYYLQIQSEIDYDFGLCADGSSTAVGKMFGVLVIQDADGRPGYLSAFSGKLAGANHHRKFVAPVYDMLAPDGFFVKSIKAIDAISAEVAGIEAHADYQRMRREVQELTAQCQEEIAGLKQQLKLNKDARMGIRMENSGKNKQELAAIETDLVRHSLHDKHLLRELTQKWKLQIEEAGRGLIPYASRINALKNERKEKSAALQQAIFEQYTFLNTAGKSKSLQAIFNDHANGKPPAAAGECATPKLLQHAFLHGYKPLAMAEFWWGASPKSEKRVHKQFYPACTDRCKPIMAHMLEGMVVDEAPCE